MALHLEFLTKNNIDFVCHDDIPYDTAGVDDAYAICKKLGKFKAT
jgi:choline-phosphate cytidylyltransferase